MHHFNLYSEGSKTKIHHAFENISETVRPIRRKPEDIKLTKLLKNGVCRKKKGMLESARESWSLKREKPVCLTSLAFSRVSFKMDVGVLQVLFREP